MCGPSGSGKSRWAEHLASSAPGSVVYLATGPDLLEDANWQHRLERHRRRRPPSWLTREVQGELSQALNQLLPQQLGLVDSLGTWVAAHLERDSANWLALQQELLIAMRNCRAELVLVAEEVTWGVVPATALGCRFRDRLSELNRRVSQLSSAHWLVVQGRALDLQTLGVPVPEPEPGPGPQ
ncbi:MAG: bifunctional adenosylcobinamide kinase/adenosylcobinamide-phosphate guanylyltransferase [Synechococcaceae cyanobacterium]